MRSAKNKKIYNTRTGGVGQVLYISVLNDPTPKKSSLLKIFGSNLLLKNRLLASTPTPPYASLREARLKFSENESSSYLVPGRGVEPPRLSASAPKADVYAISPPGRCHPYCMLSLKSSNFALSSSFFFPSSRSLIAFSPSF